MTINGSLILDFDDEDLPLEITRTIRKKLETVSSCFAQLTHKAQTIFQNNVKLEVSNPCLLFGK